MDEKDDMGFRRLAGRAISDSTENTTKLMVIYFLLIIYNVSKCLDIDWLTETQKLKRKPTFR